MIQIHGSVFQYLVKIILNLLPAAGNILINETKRIFHKFIFKSRIYIYLFLNLKITCFLIFIMFIYPKYFVLNVENYLPPPRLKTRQLVATIKSATIKTKDSNLTLPQVYIVNKGEGVLSDVISDERHFLSLRTKKRHDGGNRVAKSVQSCMTSFIDDHLWYMIISVKSFVRLLIGVKR